ncbi:MAG TPA: helix-turn-helix transcriptional regulator [Spongiibacteraceae bacterium]|jgi:DNA-binding CsgD family transcriptional regulator/PAS domain-containing protein
MQIDNELSELIGLIYEGPLEAVPWQPFLERCKQIMGAYAANLILRSPTTVRLGMMQNAGGVPEHIVTYNERGYALDPFINLPPGAVVSLHEFMGSDALLASDFYRIVLEPSGLHDILGADFRIPHEVEVRFRISREKSARSFSKHDRALVRALLPHIQRAVRLHVRINKIESERAVYAGAVDQMRVAAIILDESGRVLSVNQRARDLLEQKNGVMLRDEKLVLNTREQTHDLHTRVSRVIAHQHQGGAALVEAMRIARREGELGLVIRPVPENQWAEAEAGPAAVIFLSDPQQQAAAPLRIIKQLFGFTPAEASLAMLMANGLTLDEAAAELNISRNTVRTHLRAAFAKTGVTRQPQLVSLILKSVASLG